MEQNTPIYNIFIDTHNSRFANQVFPLMCAISLYGKYKGKFNKPYFKYHTDIPEYCMNLLKRYFNMVSYDPEEFVNNWKISNNTG